MANLMYLNPMAAFMNPYMTMTGMNSATMSGMNQAAMPPNCTPPMNQMMGIPFQSVTPQMLALLQQQQQQIMMLAQQQARAANGSNAFWWLAASRQPVATGATRLPQAVAHRCLNLFTYNTRTVSIIRGW